MKKYILTKVVAAAIFATAGSSLALSQVYDPARPYSTITPVQDLPGLFVALDRDHDGTISMAEFEHLNSAMVGVGSGQTARAGEADSSAFRVSVPNDDDIRAIYRRLDVNGDGQVTLAEFMAFNEVMADQGGKH